MSPLGRSDPGFGDMALRRVREAVRFMRASRPAEG